MFLLKPPLRFDLDLSASLSTVMPLCDLFAVTDSHGCFGAVRSATSTQVSSSVPRDVSATMEPTLQESAKYQSVVCCSLKNACWGNTYFSGTQFKGGRNVSDPHCCFLENSLRCPEIGLPADFSISPGLGLLSMRQFSDVYG